MAGQRMPKAFDRLHQRLSDPLLTVLTLLLSFLLFALAPMQAAGLVTGQHFGYFFGLVLLPAAFLYSRNFLVAAPIGVAIALVVTAALLDFERSPRTDLYLDSAAWLIAGLTLSAVVARAVFGPGQITYHRVVGAVLLYLTIGLTFVALYGFAALATPMAFTKSSGASWRLCPLGRSHLLQLRDPDDHRLWRHCAPASLCAQPRQCRGDHRPNLSCDFTGASCDA